MSVLNDRLHFGRLYMTCKYQILKRTGVYWFGARDSVPAAWLIAINKQMFYVGEFSLKSGSKKRAHTEYCVRFAFTSPSSCFLYKGKKFSVMQHLITRLW